MCVSKKRHQKSSSNNFSWYFWTRYFRKISKKVEIFLTSAITSIRTKIWLLMWKFNYFSFQLFNNSFPKAFLKYFMKVSSQLNNLNKIFHIIQKFISNKLKKFLDQNLHRSPLIWLLTLTFPISKGDDAKKRKKFIFHFKFLFAEKALLWELKRI